MPVSTRSMVKRSSNAQPSKRAKANATSRSVLKNIPSELLNIVLNHASPQSRRRLSQVNKSLKSMARVGGETVYSKKTPTWYMGMELYKRGNNGYLKPLQPHGKPFQYYKKNLLRTPITLNEKNAALNNLRLVREKAKNRWSTQYFSAFRVKSKSPPKRKTN